ncbi:MAG: insulinase family protein [Bacteroidaceae bacterium]|nr:insulinase family protein [Bacteroidaceae bacterium]
MIHIKRHVLANGLRIIYSEDLTTQMVAINMAYHVGARDEHPDHTGFAHLFEHLMFGGSVHIPDFDSPIQEAGGENNAWTNNDITNYYITLPCQNAEIGFWLESDRMLSLAFTPKSLEVQRQVVTEEFKQQCLNKPYGDASHLLRSLAYKVHPYQWPTLGKDISHILQAQMEEVKDFFFRFYAPNNAVLAVTGHISFEETVRLAEKWFGDIPRRDVAERNLPQEPEQKEYRHLEVERPVPLDSLYMAFPMCGRNDPDYFAFDMLSDLLSNGKSSRLVLQLVRRTPLFSSIDAFIHGSEDPGLIQIVGKLLPGVSFQQAEEAVFAELQKLSDELIQDSELEKVKNKFESAQIMGNLNYLNLATNLAQFEIWGKAEDVNKEVARYREVSALQIQDVAKRTFVREKANVLYYSKKK